MLEKYLGDLGLTAFVLIIAIVFIPIFLGWGLSLLVHADGMAYHTITILFALLIWMIIGIYFCQVKMKY